MNNIAKNVPKFEIGQLVKCIRSHSDGMFKEGQVFEIQGIKRGCSHNPTLLDVGIKTKAGMECHICKCDFGRDNTWVTPAKFIPLDDIKETYTIEELLEEMESFGQRVSATL